MRDDGEKTKRGEIHEEIMKGTIRRDKKGRKGEKRRDKKRTEMKVRKNDEERGEENN